MEFSGQYLTFTEYRGLGGTLAETPFNLLEFESRRQIDIRTQNRLRGIDRANIPQEVKLCIYHLIGSIDNYAKSIDGASDNVSSETIDGYSVTYLNGTQIKEILQSKSAELNDIIRNYLLEVNYNGEHLMYLGVD